MPGQKIEGTAVSLGDLVITLSLMQDQLDDLLATVEEQGRQLREVRAQAGMAE